MIKRLIIGCVSLLIVVGIIFWSRYDFANPLLFNFTSDAEMISNFRKHKVKFERLIEMGRADSKLERIPDDRNPGLPDDRWDEYRNTLRELRLPGITAAPNMNGYIFYVETCGGLFSPVTEYCSVNGSKGYVYSGNELSPQFDSLDILEATKVGEPFVFRKIEKDWYLFFRFPS